MSFIFKVFHNERLIVKKYRGSISILELQEILIKTMQLNEEFPNYNVLNDYRYSKFVFDNMELSIVLKGITLKELPSQTKVFIFENVDNNPIYDLYVHTYKFKNTHVFNSLLAASKFYNVHMNLYSKFLDSPSNTQ